jgi:hypothetical protein
VLTDVIDVYTITEDVAILHNVIALVNADPVLYASVRRHGCVALAHIALQLDGTAQRINHR